MVSEFNEGYGEGNLVCDFFSHIFNDFHNFCNKFVGLQ